jgi:hypothetical protein
MLKESVREGYIGKQGMRCLLKIRFFGAATIKSVPIFLTLPILGGFRSKMVFGRIERREGNKTCPTGFGF